MSKIKYYQDFSSEVKMNEFIHNNNISVIKKVKVTSSIFAIWW